MKRQSWDCTNIKIKLHKISTEELKQRLAELWQVLVEESCQFVNSQTLVPAKSKSRNHRSSPLNSFDHTRRPNKGRTR